MPQGDYSEVCSMVLRAGVMSDHLPFLRPHQWFRAIIDNCPNYENVNILNNINDIRNGVFSINAIHLDPCKVVILNVRNICWPIFLLRLPPISDSKPCSRHNRHPPVSPATPIVIHEDVIYPHGKCFMLRWLNRLYFLLPQIMWMPLSRKTCMKQNHQTYYYTITTVPPLSDVWGRRSEVLQNCPNPA